MNGGGFDILQSLQSAFTTFLSYVPNVIGALLVLIIGYIIARLLRAGISRLLRKVRVDEKLTHGSGGEYVARFSPQGRPSQLVGLVVQYVLMVFVIVSAVGTLNIPAVTGFVNLVVPSKPATPKNGFGSSASQNEATPPRVTSHCLWNAADGSLTALKPASRS